MTKSRKGFASMDPELVKKIASAGGKASQATGTAHKFSKAEAASAGRLGGLATWRNKRKKAKTNGEEEGNSGEEEGS